MQTEASAQHAGTREDAPGIMEQARTPKLLCAEAECGETYSDIVHRRATLYTNRFKQQPQDDMLHLMAYSLKGILEKPCAADLKELVTAKSKKKTLNYMSIFSELRRLMPAATPRILRDKQLDLNSEAGLDLLLKYVSKTKATWKSTRMDEQTTLRGVTTALLEEADANEVVAGDFKSLTVMGQGNVTTAGRASSFSVESRQLLLDAVSTPEYLWVEDRLRAHAQGRPLPNRRDPKLEAEDKRLQAIKGLPDWYHPIKDVLESESGLMKRALLGFQKIPPKNGATQIAALRKHLDAFIHLRLAWDEKAELTDALLGFRAKQQFVTDLKAGLLTKLQSNVLSSVHEENRIQVHTAFERRDHGQRDLIDDRYKAREHHKLLMDRALLCLGYRNVERLGAMPLSYGAALDTFEAFLEAGDSLSGSMLTAHEGMALDHLDGVAQEAEAKLSTFLHSEDPGADHPGVIINKTGVAHLKLKRRHDNTKGLMKLSEYPGVVQLLSGQRLAPDENKGDGVARTGDTPTRTIIRTDGGVQAKLLNSSWLRQTNVESPSLTRLGTDETARGVDSPHLLVNGRAPCI